MTETRHRIRKGTGKVVFLANLQTISELLAAGWPMSVVYERTKDSLAGLSYRMFINHVHKNALRPPARKSPPSTNVQSFQPNESGATPAASPQPVPGAPNKPISAPVAAASATPGTSAATQQAKPHTPLQISKERLDEILPTFRHTTTNPDPKDLW